MLLSSCVFTPKSTISPQSNSKAILVEEVSIPQLSVEEQQRYNYYFLEAIRLKMKDEYDAAFELLQHCLEINPYAASALYEVAQYHLYLKQQSQGISALEKAVSYAPENFWYSQALVNLYQQQQQPEKAIKVLLSMRQRFPNKLEPVYNLMDLYTRIQRYDEVINILNHLEERMGKSEQLSMEKFRIFTQMNDEKKSLQEIENLVKEYPKELRYRVLLGDIYLQRQNFDEAYKNYQEVLENEPDNALALYSMANYYEATEQKELYEQQLDTLLLNKKVPSDTKLNVMTRFVIQNESSGRDSTRIITLFDRILEQEPDDAALPTLYAQYLLSKGMNDKALPILNMILDIEPANTAARMTLLNEAIKKENYQEIHRLCDAGIAANPEVMEFYFYLAIAYNHDEKTEETLEVIKQAITQITPETSKELVSDFYTIMGDAYHTKNMNTEAYQAYDKALEYNPDNIGALNNYAYYLSLEKRDLDKAEEMSYKTVKAEPTNATYLDTYAWILFEKGNYAEARIYIDEAMKSEEGNQSDVIVEHCGDIYFKTGDLESALKYWKQSLELGNQSKILKKKIETKTYIPE
ncbi:MAG: tetratricopeptide repeat protein [Mediterranea massiliensis]|nr:tetratricopeptide repeat protein [Mediterranea massiliensis]